MKEEEARLEAEIAELMKKAVVAAEVTNKSTDRRQAEPVMEVVKTNTCQLPRQMSAGAGYFSSDAVTNLTTIGIDVYMPPDKMSHRTALPHASYQIHRGYQLPGETISTPKRGGVDYHER